MKRFLALAVLVALPWSCSDSTLKPDSPQNTEIFRMSVNTGDPTKTVIEKVPDKDEYKVDWQSGDAIAVYEVSAEGVAAEKTVSDALEDNCSSASFTLDFIGSPSGPFHYSFVYPERALTKDGGKCYVTIPSTQSFKEDSWDSQADVLVSEPITKDTRPESLDVKFARLGASAKMTIMAKSTTEKIRRITFTNTVVNLTGSFELNPSDGSIGELSNGSKSLVLIPASATTYTGTIPVWFRLTPVTLSADFTVKIETDAKTYVKTVNLAAASKTLEFRAGGLTTFKVDMSGVDGKNSWDVIDLDYTGSGPSYADWGSKKGSYSDAQYYGRTVKDNDFFRITTGTPHSGIITTTSGGYVQAVKIDLAASGIDSQRRIDIYASNSAYTSIDDLWNDSKKGTVISTATASKTEVVSKTIWLSDAYQYVGIRAKDGSTMIQSISIKWEDYEPVMDEGASEDLSTGGWLELPSYTKESIAGTTTSSLTKLYELSHTALMNGVTQRNYTFLYDPQMYASYWVAYPLCNDHLAKGRGESWGYDPLVPSGEQTRLDKGAYLVYFSTPAHPKVGDKEGQYYARGHQLPNADRNGVEAMMAQTYYSTNITPQMQNGFNSGVWSSLEDAVRNEIKGKPDTLYVVTGAAFKKKGESKDVTTIVSGRDGKTLPIPNYYWKAILKVKRSAGTVTSASAVGFWLEHRDDYAGSAYLSNVVSVDQIETWTGLDLFSNLDAALQTTAEGNTSWSDFQNF